MNTKVHKLLAATMLASGILSADSSTNKTFMNYRSTGVNLARQYGTAWHDKLHRPKEKGRWGGEFQATLFYEDSTNGSSIGKYFGFDGRRKLHVGEGCTECIDVDRRHFIHNCKDEGDCRLTGTIKLSGTRDAWGVELSYYQNLDFLFDGFYWLLNAPIVHEENELSLLKLKKSRSSSASCPNCPGTCPCPQGQCTCPSGCQGGCPSNKSGSSSSCSTGCPTTSCPDTSCPKKCPDLCEVKQTIVVCRDGETTQEKTVGIADYFAGGVTQAQPNTQAALNRARIRSDQSQTELGDLDLILGWDFYREADAHVGVNLGITFPTSSNGKTKHLWEPLAGNGDHWGLGGGATASFVAWHSDEARNAKDMGANAKAMSSGRYDQELEVVFALNYRYLFESEERRVVGVKGQNWAHYMLVGTVGSVGVQPAANLLSVPVDVTPGSQVDALIGLSYHWGDFIFDLGYNLFARETEDVDLKKNSWTDCCVGFAGNNYCTDRSDPCFGPGDTAECGVTIGCSKPRVGGEAGNFINRADLTTSPAETPNFTTHKLYGGVGYTFAAWEYPLQAKFGAYYEWASSRKSPENWSIFGGLALSF